MPDYVAGLKDWAASGGPGEPPRPYADGIKRMVMPNAPVIGNDPRVQQAVKNFGWSLLEPFGQLGRVITGQSENVPQDVLMAGAGLLPGPRVARTAAKAAEEVAGPAMKDILEGITAYHGSPHDFEKFDLSKIGTGEGAQAFGHGLYFAENERVAKDYRRVLAAKADMSGANRMDAEALKYVNAHGGVEQAKSAVDAEMKQWADNPNTVAYLQKLKDAIREPNPGHMYQVNIKADPEHFLDWDKPLSEQHPKVREAVKSAYDAAYPQGNKELRAKDWESLQHASGEHLVRKGGIAFDDDRTAKLLREAGVPGIKYLDQGSRGKGEGTSNYVVFDDKLIDIMKKYGIAGIGALPAAGMYHFQQHQDQN